MLNPLRLFSTALLAFLGIVCAPRASAAATTEAATAPALVTLNFPGGTLAQFADALEKAYHHPVNLIMPKNDAVAVPPIRVTGVNLQELFAAIGQAELGLAFVPAPGGRKDEADGGRDTTVWAVRVASSEVEPQRAHSFSIEQLLTKYTINDITTAVKTVWDMARVDDADASSRQIRRANRQVWMMPGPDPDLKFHQETNLLIVRGNSYQVDLASDVLGQLKQAMTPPPGPTRSPDEIANLKAQALDLEAARLTLEADLNEMQKHSADPAQITAQKARLRAIEERIKMSEAAANGR